MTKQKALLMMMEIVAECSEHSNEGNSCTECPFGSGVNCLLSAGNDIPTDWRINETVRRWLEGENK